jgi:hypothetical protein
MAARFTLAMMTPSFCRFPIVWMVAARGLPYFYGVFRYL